MSGGFNMDDYVDVAERIHSFYERFPDGSLQSGEPPRLIEAGGKAFIAYHALAFRTPDDARPAHGWAWETVPGPTQFTRDSELQNAETSAWGRAIVALGFETKKIASAQEVRARQADNGNTFKAPTEAEVEQREADALGLKAARADAIDDNGDPAAVRVHFSKNAGKTLGELSPASRKWYAESWEPDTSKYPLKPEDRRLRLAARMLSGLPVPETEGVFASGAAATEDEIPF